MRYTYKISINTFTIDLLLLKIDTLTKIRINTFTIDLLLLKIDGDSRVCLY